MHREPFASNVIWAAGDDPAIGTRAGAFRNHRLYRYRDLPPAAWLALAHTESVGASCSAPIRTANKCWSLVNLTRAKHQQGAPL
jgi:hypothetical protein